MAYRDYAYFCGTHRSRKYPEVDILHEEKHPNGHWISVFTPASSGHFRSGEFFVGRRASRHQGEVEALRLRRNDPTLGARESDDSFLTEEAAFAAMRTVIQTPDHPLVPKLYQKLNRDGQRSKAYKLDGYIAAYIMITNQIDLPVNQIAADALVKQMCGRFNISTIPVTFKEFRDQELAGDCNYHEIRLRTSWATELVLLHELAHHFVHRTWMIDRTLTNEERYSIQSHGPEFVGWYKVLAQTRFNIPDGDFEKLITRANVKHKAPKLQETV